MLSSGELMTKPNQKILVTWVIKNMPSIIESISLHDTEEEARLFIKEHKDPDLHVVIHNRMEVRN
jgi:hypothetical protein